MQRKRNKFLMKYHLRLADCFWKLFSSGESSNYILLSGIEKNKNDFMNILTIWLFVMMLLNVLNIVSVSLLPLDLCARVHQSFFSD